MMQADRDQLALDLAALSEPDLIRRCVRDILEQNRYRRDKHLYEVLMMDLDECLKRDKTGRLYRLAKEQAKAQLAEKRRRDSEATAALGRRVS